MVHVARWMCLLPAVLHSCTGIKSRLQVSFHVLGCMQAPRSLSAWQSARTPEDMAVAVAGMVAEVGAAMAVDAIEGGGMAEVEEGGMVAAVAGAVGDTAGGVVEGEGMETAAVDMEEGEVVGGTEEDMVTVEVEAMVAGAEEDMVMSQALVGLLWMSHPVCLLLIGFACTRLNSFEALYQHPGWKQNLCSYIMIPFTVSAVIRGPD